MRQGSTRPDGSDGMLERGEMGAHALVEDSREDARGDSPEGSGVHMVLLPSGRRLLVISAEQLRRVLLRCIGEMQRRGPRYCAHFRCFLVSGQHLEMDFDFVSVDVCLGPADPVVVERANAKELLYAVVGYYCVLLSYLPGLLAGFVALDPVVLSGAVESLDRGAMETGYAQLSQTLRSIKGVPLSSGGGWTVDIWVRLAADSVCRSVVLCCWQGQEKRSLVAVGKPD